jgi:hypothetical protein
MLTLLYKSGVLACISRRGKLKFYRVVSVWISKTKKRLLKCERYCDILVLAHITFNIANISFNYNIKEDDKCLIIKKYLDKFGGFNLQVVYNMNAEYIYPQQDKTAYSYYIYTAADLIISGFINIRKA